LPRETKKKKGARHRKKQSILESGGDKRLNGREKGPCGEKRGGRGVPFNQHGKGIYTLNLLGVDGGLRKVGGPAIGGMLQH